MAVCVELPAPITVNNVLLLDAWQEAEDGSWGNPDTFNTLDTTYAREPDAYRPNAYPFFAYATFQTGANAQVETLLTGAPSYNYAPIIADLRANAPASTTAQAILSSSWGTQPTIVGDLTSGLTWVPRYTW